MAVLDARNADEIFRMSINATVKFAAHLSHSPTSYKWRTAGADDILATGFGMAVDAAGKPRAGTVTRFTIDLSHDDTARSNDIDVTITGLRLIRCPAGPGPFDFSKIVSRTARTTATWPRATA